MRRVAEIIYIVEEERENFLKGAINLTNEESKVLWLCGVRKQQYFALNDLIFLTFEYEGKNFEKDMEKMASYLDSKGLLVKNRRKDVPISERETTNWWAPVKKLGSLLENKPFEEDEEQDYHYYFDGNMSTKKYDIAYDEDDWSEGIHI